MKIRYSILISVLIGGALHAAEASKSEKFTIVNEAGNQEYAIQLKYNPKISKGPRSVRIPVTPQTKELRQDLAGLLGMEILVGTKQLRSLFDEEIDSLKDNVVRITFDPGTKEFDITIAKPAIPGGLQPEQVPVYAPVSERLASCREELKKVEKENAKKEAEISKLEQQLRSLARSKN